MISRRHVIGWLGAGVAAFTLHAVPVALALSPEARNASLDETLRGLVEGCSPPGTVVLILENCRPVYSRSVGVREVGSVCRPNFETIINAKTAIAQLKKGTQTSPARSQLQD